MVARKVLPIVVLVATLAATTRADAQYSASDSVDSNTKMDLRLVSSRVDQGTIAGHPAKIVRFKVVFTHPVPWAKLHIPDLRFTMDTRSTPTADYWLDIFRKKIAGDTHRMHCWLRNASGEVVLGDDGVVSYSASGKVATCAFPKGAMSVRPNGNVRWIVQSLYAASSSDLRTDMAPDGPPYVFPHL